MKFRRAMKLNVSELLYEVGNMKRGQWVDLDKYGKVQFLRLNDDGSIIVTLKNGINEIINKRDENCFEVYLNGPDLDDLIKIYIQRGGSNGRRSFKDFLWSRIIKENSEFKCQICSSKIRIQSHHLDGYQEHKDSRLDVKNGICLCEKCHIVTMKQEGMTITQKMILWLT